MLIAIFCLEMLVFAPLPVNMKVKKQLTIETLREYKGLEYLSDHEVEQIVDALKKFARIPLRAYRIKKEQEKTDKR